MTSFGPNVDPIVALSLHVDSKYFSVAVLTWVVHEIIITGDDAVNLFWMQRWSISKVVFFVNGFAAVFIMIIVNSLNLMAFDSEYVRLYLKTALLEVALSDLFVYRRKWPYSMLPRTSIISLTLAFRCAVLTGCQFVSGFLILLTETFMLATRVWALWRGSYIILTIYFLVVSANVCNYLFTYGLALIKGTVFLKQSPYTGCWVNPRYNTVWIGIPNALGFETLSIGLIICKSWLIRRVTGIKTPLFSMLLQDGLAHYLLFIASKLFIVGSLLVPTTLSAVALPGSLPIAIAALAVNRLFLRLRRTMLNRTPGLTDYATVRFATARHGTSGGKGIATVRGSDKARLHMHGQRYSDLDGELSTLGEGDVEMSLRNKDGELHPTASTRRCSTILLTPETPGSSINVDVSALDSKPCHAV